MMEFFSRLNDFVVVVKTWDNAGDGRPGPYKVDNLIGRVPEI